MGGVGGRSGVASASRMGAQALPPRQDALCTPARRLLQDSQDVPVTVTPLQAERVLLFDDILVLLQVGGATRSG